jgi:phosphatidylcholine synthase
MAASRRLRNKATICHLPMKTSASKHPPKWAAWCVHLLTASGIIPAFLAILAIEESDFRAAMLWLGLAFLIDGIDGSLARRFKVWEVLPQMNGKNMDFVIDFTTYALIPAYFFYQAELVASAWALPATLLMLVVSVVYYGKEGMTSEDQQYFMGFPVLWNIVVFYLFFVFHWPAWGNLLSILLLSVFHFVPIRFAYPSRGKHWRYLTLAMSVLFGASAMGILWYQPEEVFFLRLIAGLVMLYFIFLTIYDTLREAKRVVHQE